MTAWQWARTHSPALVQLESWGDDPSLLQRYQALGFAPMLREVSYRRDLDLAAEA